MLFKILSVCTVLCFFQAYSDTKASAPYANQFEEALEIATQHVSRPSYQSLVNKAISSMLSSLDENSSYLVGEEVEEFLQHTSGRFGGVGIEMETDEEGGISVVYAIENLPAEKAGICPGDRIISVDGMPTKDLGFEKTARKIRGKSGTKVTIAVQRPAVQKPIVYELTRVIIKTPPIRSEIDREIGYIKLEKFSPEASTELRKVVSNWAREKKPLLGIILDLRNNPGGFLDQGVSVSEYFLESGDIVGIKGRDGHINMIRVKQSSVKAPKIPVIVLINQRSASASEIVAGALQDNKRAVIMGTSSFGKGTVQTLVKTTKYNAVIKITTALYCTPKGKFIDKKGIIPDVVVEQPKPNLTGVQKIRERKLIQDADLQYQRAHELIKSMHYFKTLEAKQAFAP